MRINLSTVGKFHTFDLARELHKKNLLGDVYTGYPMFKLQGEGIPKNKINTFPYIHAPYMTSAARALNKKIRTQWEWLDAKSFEGYVNHFISNCDIFVGLSGSALMAGRKVKSRGGIYVCDRGSTHIKFQNQILLEEFDVVGIPFQGIDRRTIDQEESEYIEADLITVPSAFNVASFASFGISSDKVRKVPYGVDLTRFHPVESPSDNSFDVLFVGALSPRKGVHYLVDAFDRLTVSNKTLHLVGNVDNEYLTKLKQRPSWNDRIRIYGAMPQYQLKSIMSRSHVMGLPSVEEGLAMVQAQAMACACPVIATENTGARDLFDDGVEGFIVPIRNSDEIAGRLQRLVDDRSLRDQMGQRALARVRALGGWNEYGDNAVSEYKRLLKVVQ